MEVRVVGVRSFCDNAAAEKSRLAVLARCGQLDGSGEELLVATSEVLLEHWLIPGECTVCVLSNVEGVELALIWQPNVTSFSAASARFGTVLSDRQVDLFANLGLQTFTFDGTFDCGGFPLFLEEEHSVGGIISISE